MREDEGKDREGWREGKGGKEMDRKRIERKWRSQTRGK